MTVYVVTDGTYSDYHIEAVFTDREKAKLYAAIHHCASIEEYETHDDNLNGDAKTYYKHYLRAYPRGGELDLKYYGDGEYATQRYNGIDDYGAFLHITVSLEEKNSRKAFKIASDMVAQWLEGKIAEYRKHGRRRLLEYMRELNESEED